MESTQNFYNLQLLTKLGIEYKKIGILGGSFNPPHSGHLEISKKALEHGLNYILWLVVPQNNLKPHYELSLEERVKLCCKLTDNDNRILISSLEAEIISTNSYDTIEFLKKHFPKTKFIWIMGIDCLKDFHLWENYDKLLRNIDIMIFNRKGYINFFEDTIAGKLINKSYKDKVTFIPEIISELSSTQIRNSNKIWKQTN